MKKAPLYNSQIETGLRALAVLDAFYPRGLRLTELTWLEHLVVHTEDVDGPPSLHPDVGPRTGELLVRRRLVEESLGLMRRTNLVEMKTDAYGVFYLASDNAPAFLELLQTPYNIALQERARWLSTRFRTSSRAEIEAVVKERVGRWTAEFQAPEQPGDLTP